MNIETVRSLTAAFKCAGEWVRTKGENKQALADMKYHVGQAMDTEQDLRNTEFVNAIRQLERIHLSGNESKVVPPKPSPAPVTSIKAPMAAESASKPSPVASTVASAGKSSAAPDPYKSKDLTAKDSGLA